jgi:hypothetical protein
MELAMVPTATPKTARKDTLAVYAKQLTSVLEKAAGSEKATLEHAIAAGELCVKGHAHLRADPMNLQKFGEWFKANVKGFSQRTASDYQRVYEQVNFDSKTCYQSISEVLKTSRLRLGKRDRFDSTLLKTQSKEAIDAAPVPALPEHERPSLEGGFAEWLESGDQQPDEEEQVNVMLADAANLIGNLRPRALKLTRHVPNRNKVRQAIEDLQAIVAHLDVLAGGAC